MIGLGGIGAGPIGFEGDDFVESRNLALSSLSPTINTSTHESSLETKSRLELDADTPTAEIIDITGVLGTKGRIELESTSPNVNVSNTDSVLQTSDPVLVTTSPSGTVNVGDLVTIIVEGEPDTLTTSAGVIPIESLDGSGTLTFFAPDLPLFGDKSLLFNSAITVTVSKGARSDTFDLVIEQEPDELFHEIESIDPNGVYFGDGAIPGDYSHFKNFTGDVTIDPADGSYMVSADSTVEYNLYTTATGQWDVYRTLTFVYQEVLELDADSPEVAVDDVTAGLETSGTLELDVDSPEVAVDGVTGSLITGDDVPVITVIGGDLTFDAGEIYLDPGVTALDSVDGDISEKVIVEGVVNTWVPGVYNVSYSVTNSRGLQSGSYNRIITISGVVGEMITVEDEEFAVASLRTSKDRMHVTKGRDNTTSVTILKKREPLDISTFTRFTLSGATDEPIDTDLHPGTIAFGSRIGQLVFRIGSLLSVDGQFQTTLIGYSPAYPNGVVLWDDEMPRAKVLLEVVESD